MVQENKGLGASSLRADRATRQSPSPSVSALRASIASAARGRGTVFYIPEEQATTPASGECIANSWWTVHPEHGVAFYAQLLGYLANETPSPQCNQSEGTARRLSAKLYPGHEVRLIPAVFMRHADRAMAVLRAQAIEARRAETANAGSVHESAVAAGDAPEGDRP